MSEGQSLEDFQAVVLSGLLCEKSKDKFQNRMGIILKEVGERFFSLKGLAIYKIILNYYNLTFSRIVRSDFVKAVQLCGVPDSTVFEYQVIFDNFMNSEPVEDNQFVFSIQVLKERTRSFLAMDTLSDAAEILSRGKKVGKTNLFGYSQARQYLAEKMGEIDALSEQAVVLDGDIVTEGDDVLREYIGSKNKSTPKVHTGIREFDSITKGLGNGELILLAGFTGDGKSMLCVNIANHVVFKQRLNVVYATGETLRNQVRKRAWSLRSRDPIYGNPEGLLYTALKDGTLTTEQEQILMSMLKDMGSGQYGSFTLFQFPANTTVEFLAAQLSRYQARFNVDLFIVDELRLLIPNRKRQASWEELDDIIRSLKRLAVSHNGGRGVPLISPYQVRRDDWKQATESSKPYDRTCLAKSSEAEQSADVIWTMRKIQKDTGVRQDEIIASIVKNRDGEIAPEFHLAAEFATCYIGSKTVMAEDLL